MYNPINIQYVLNDWTFGLEKMSLGILLPPLDGLGCKLSQKQKILTSIKMGVISCKYKGFKV